MVTRGGNDFTSLQSDILTVTTYTTSKTRFYMRYRKIKLHDDPPPGWEWWRSSYGFHLRHIATMQLTWQSASAEGCLRYAQQWEEYWAKEEANRPQVGAAQADVVG